VSWSVRGLEAIRAWLRGWVDSGRLPSAHDVILHEGTPVLSFGRGGIADTITDDTVLHIYSMTKPLAAAAALQLVERGQLALDDPLARYIPAFAHVTVNRGRSGDVLDPVPATTPIRIRDLLTHTAGFTYGEGNPGAVSKLYVEQRCDFLPGDGPLSEVVERLAGIPLLFEPGSAWNYGVASDVLGRVIEVAAGRPLDQVIRDGILEPLGMHAPRSAPSMSRRDASHRCSRPALTVPRLGSTPLLSFPSRPTA
jgi:CubicO group peptidase (beta-lactamase class C family)